MTVRLVLEPAAQAFVEATTQPPFLYQFDPAKGHAVVDSVQSPQARVAGTSVTTVEVGDGLSVEIFRPDGAEAALPVVVYTHGAGWVFGNARTHGPLVRELALAATQRWCS